MKRQEQRTLTASLETPTLTAGDARGKSMSLIKTHLSSAPYPLLSDADRFEFHHPGLMTAARDEQARTQAAKLSRKDEEASSARAAAEACWVLLCNVPDALELPLLKKLVASSSKEPVHSLWEKTPPNASPDDGLDYIASFLDAAAATRACANLRGNLNLPFSSRQTAAQGLMEQTKVTRREASNDSWRDDSVSGGSRGAESESWRSEMRTVAHEVGPLKEEEEANSEEVVLPPTATLSAIPSGEAVESWEDLADLAISDSGEIEPKNEEAETVKGEAADETANGAS